jgi:hypothetical protein
MKSIMKKLAIMNMKKLILISILVCLTCSLVQAGPTPASYGTATHVTDKWQDILTVSWSIDGAAFGNDYTPLGIGQTLQFQVDMHKTYVGTHYADHIKAWLDLDQSGDFAEPDVILYAERLLTDHYTTLGSYVPATDTPVSYFSDTINILPEHAGDLWFRARVTCSHSLVAANGGEWNDQWTDDWTQPIGDNRYERTFSPTGQYHQGDSVDIGLTVVPIPAPGAILLGSFGVSIVGWLRRRRAL